MPIHSLQLTNVGPFRRRPDGNGSDGIELEFDPHVNLFIGPNNVGKSTILWFLAGLGVGRFRRLGALMYPSADSDCAYTIEYTDLGGQLHKIEGRTFLKDFGVNGAVARQLNIGYVGYDDGVVPDRNIRTSAPPADSDRPVLDQEDILINMLADTEFQRDRYADVLSALQDSRYERDHAVATVISTVSAEIFLDFPIGFATATSSGSESTEEDSHMSTTMDGDVAFGQLSHGTRSVFSSVFHLSIAMAQYYEEGIDWKRMPGIFILDEIDAHLHPSWQRRIIPTLQRHFPNVQIFASTHSPMMVAGLKKGQVHLLKRDGTGQVVWSRNEQDIIGWTADEIYRTFMGIDDPTDELTVQRANRLRELRDKIPRTEVEEEELQNLRKQVNQDLLAGGHLNAQRERYAGLMEKFLRSRMADLSQDGA